MEAAVRILLLLQLYFGVGLVAGGTVNFWDSFKSKKSIDCDSAMGMESGKIPDSALKAASVYSAGYEPSKGRLNKPTSYIARTNDIGQWIQVDLGKVAKVTRIGTQGRYNVGQWVTKFIVSYSIDGGYFQFQMHKSYNFPREYIANTNYQSVVVNTLDEPLIARYIRIHPVAWHGYISMRIELYGCFSGFSTPEPPVCMAGLGLENRNIPDSSITASSMNSATYRPSLGRLHHYYGWLAGTSNQQQWFQVDFGSWTKVTRVSTQGRQNAAQWITKYKLGYSYDGVFYEEYKEDGGQVKEFEGNTDQYMVVSHLLKKPIVTRYIRIIPISWQGAIALRTDFYGCKSGFDIPKIVCASPLGMENGKIPDSAIVASSRHNQYWGPDRGRLNEKKEGSFQGGWISQYADANQFLQIDLGKVTKVTRIATQGRYDAGWWSKTYTLAYSVDGGTFMLYNNGQVLQGNTDNVNPEGRILDPPIIARFIKINVKTFQGYPSLRVELYGCIQGFPTPKPPQCMEALGMENSQISDSAITASSSYNVNSFAPSIGRLHFLSAGSGKYGSWAAGANNENQWFQVDLGSWTKLSAVATQGRQDADQWVKTYSLSFSYDGVFWETVNNEHDVVQVFTANSDRYTVVRNVLDKPVITRYIRIHPRTWNAYISMRTEFYGCREGFQPPKLQCQSELGMKSRKIPNSAITATTTYNQYYGPERARLDTVKSGSFNGAWIPKTQDMGQWIQVDLGKITKITRIATRGRQDAAQWVKSYSITYSLEGGPFLPYNNNQVLIGNTDSNTIVGHILNPPIVARYIRIHPKEYQSYMALRFELYGCTQEFKIPVAHLCEAALGMQNNKIPDSALRASTSYNVNSMGPRNGRLHFQPSSGQYGAWAVSTNNEFQHFEVNFGDWTKVTKVATQGRQDGAWWVKSYSLSYSYDGVFFEDCKEDNEVKVFTGNSDQYSVMIHTLKNPIITRYLRIKPKTWNSYISLRAEFYGCRKGFTPPQIKCRDPLGIESGKIPSSAIVASSQYNQYYGPDRGRLRTEGEGSYGGGWAAQYNDVNQFLQFDLGKVIKVTAVATQGRSDANWMVTSYTLAYSVDGGSFTPYGEGDGQVFNGNNLDRNEAVGNIIDPPITARFVQFRVKTWKGHISMRAEFYGCTKGFSRPPICLEALGMQNGKIPDSAITASSEYNAASKAINGRLHFLLRPGRYGAWIAKRNDIFQYLQINFGDWTKVSRIAIQGRQDADQWVKSFSLSYGYDAVFFKDYNENDAKKIFAGNNDRYTPVTHDLKIPIIAHYIRINPKTWQSHISMRAELYGCKEGFEPPELQCQSELGMKSGKIPDSAITATTSYSQYYGPERARLDTVKSGSFNGAWIPKTQDMGQWIQVDLGNITKITRIATQGRQDAAQWVKSYSITYSVNGGPFLLYNKNQILPGNKDSNTIVGNILNPPIVARYIRIHPKEYQSYMALRFELFGCTEGFLTPPVSPCQTQLGMQNNKLPNSALSVSSQYNGNTGPENARLHFYAESGRKGAWVAQKQDLNQWLQVDFGVETVITRIATQGRQDANQWVKEYTLRYSTDGSYFKHYQPFGYTKTFEGNNDRYTVVSHNLIPPISARYLRIIPEEWQSYIALRAEFYGCKKSDGGYSIWSVWSQCSATCGDGRRSRARSCTNPPPSPGGKNCSQLGPDRQTEECNVKVCPVDGGYGSWQEWSKCSKTCGRIPGTKRRVRLCNNPEPENGGKDCSSLGKDSETTPCTPKEQRCPVDGGYGSWQEWSECSKTCGRIPGTKRRVRFCNNPEPQNGGKDCSSLGEDSDTTPCTPREKRCLVDGGYGSWQEWSECSKTCGRKPGTKRRVRLCNNPKPQNGGKDCSSLGEDSETTPCKPKTKRCPVDGGYGKWGRWSKCSKTCGGGKQKRSRKCNNPVPRGGGKDCDVLGPSQKTRKCNVQSCGGIWKPIGCYKMISRALYRSFVTVENKPSNSERFQACVKKADEEGINLFGMDDKRCWTSDDTEQTYYKFGSSGNCSKNHGKATGLTKSLTVFVYQKDDQGDWLDVGCFLSTGPRALPTPFGKNISSVRGNNAMFEYCKSEAEALGYKTFGIDDKACWTGDSAEKTYDDNGKSTKCPVTFTTGNGSGRDINGDIFVYQLEE